MPARKYDYYRMCLGALIACLVMIGMFAINNEILIDYIAELEEKKDSPNLVWLVKHFAVSIPTLSVVIVMCAVYHDKQKYVPVYTQREKLYISLVVAALTIITLIFIIIDDGVVDAKDGTLSLLEKTYTWFAAQIVPLSVLIAYHTIRMGSEKRELEEAGTKK